MNQDEAEEIKNKLLKIEELPTYKEVKALMVYLEQEKKRIEKEKGLGDSALLGWNQFCQKNHISLAFNRELVLELAKEIKKLNSEPIIELGAGNGKLSFYLRKLGDIDIKATDLPADEWDYTRDTKYVEILSGENALKKYKPKTVLISWLSNQKMGINVLKYPTVEFYIDIGEGETGATGFDELVKIKGWEHTELENVQEYCISRSDRIKQELFGLEHFSPNWVHLFKRKQ